MKISIFLAVLATIGTGAFSIQQAFATTHHAAAPKALRIVMHDPGCHWFKIGRKFTKAATVKTGRVRLVNLDEATLKVASHRALRHIPVGKSIIVGRGKYVIMMVGQAIDDNYLKLTVR